ERGDRTGQRAHANRRCTHHKEGSRHRQGRGRPELLVGCYRSDCMGARTMTRTRTLGGVLGLIVGVAASVAAVLFNYSTGGSAGQAENGQARPAGRPIPMVANSSSLEITLGLKDKQQVFWEGDVQISQGKILGLEIVRAGQMSQVEGTHFKVRARRMMQ